MTLKIGVIGSRQIPTKKKYVVKELFGTLMDWQMYGLADTIEIVSGGAKRGVDLWAKEYGEWYYNIMDIDYKEFRPKFMVEDKEYDVNDYHERNRKIAEYSDIVFAIQYDNSKGTQSTIDACNDIGTPVIVFEVE